jgi:ABC-2 type transport system ATP-binding protein
LVTPGDSQSVAAIRAEGLAKSYGDVEALVDLSLSVERGECLGLLGANGAGKTTTIDVLVGRVAPDAGRAEVLGVDPTRDPVGVRERVGVLPERASPPSFLTPREYFEFVATVRGVDDATREARVAEWADRLSFGTALDTLCADLSRGQQQKAMVTATFLHEPAVVLVDEPLVNLDPVMQERVKRFLDDYRAAGNAVVLSTHHIETAAAVCTRVAVVGEGRVRGEHRPADLGDGELLDAFLAEA